ncbi:MAG: hypothetical protein ACFFCZ_20515 [Promethearchaeota archaeon]
MKTWKTYLLIWHSSEGDNPYVVMEKVSKLGFVPTIGHYDLEFDHGKKVDLHEVMALAVKVHETLKGSNVLYKIETRPSED